MGEVRRVDDDENVGRRGDDRVRGLADAREQVRQALDHRHETHDGDVGHGIQALQAFRLHRLAADAAKGDVAAGRLSQRPHQLVAELVAGLLSRDHEHIERAAVEPLRPLAHARESATATGVQMARSPPSRMKSRISCTCG